LAKIHGDGAYWSLLLEGLVGLFGSDVSGQLKSCDPGVLVLVVELRLELKRCWVEDQGRLNGEEDRRHNSSIVIACVGCTSILLGWEIHPGRRIVLAGAQSGSCSVGLYGRGILLEVLC